MKIEDDRFSGGSSWKYWEDRAEEYHEHLEQGKDPFQDECNTPIVLDMITHIPIDIYKVLDLACGNGRFTARMSWKLFSSYVIGVDSSPTLIRHARERGLDHASFEIGNITSPFSFPQGSLDLVVAKMAFPSIPNIVPCIQEMARVVRIGGYAVISTLHERYFSEYLKKKFDIWLYFFERNRQIELRVLDDEHSIEGVRRTLDFLYDELDRNPGAIWASIAGSEFTIPVYPHTHKDVIGQMILSGYELQDQVEVRCPEDFLLHFPQWRDRRGLPIVWNAIWQKGK